ncbi:MAG: glycogen synthase GlgA, partial [Alphaproteobacteria bacterium]|nr:glycogen synthase GlgA [Alphaproteobacteria bacterium]
MRTLFVTSEAFPLVKTGGLADVSAALPAALRNLGIDARLLLPRYRQVSEVPNPREVLHLGDLLGCGETRLLETFLPHSDVPVWLIDCPRLYDRDGGPYQDLDGEPWKDNHLRFALLNHVAARFADDRNQGWMPDIIHANDWHAGLVPLLLQRYRRRPASVMTVHNLAYQGVFEAAGFEQLGLPAEAFSDMEFYGRISFLKAGIRAADAITTVSQTYAKEILTPEYGCGLDGLLRERAAHLTGILNGVDYYIWDPSGDPHLACNYTAGSSALKSINKRVIQMELGLDPAADKPLLAFMSRLVHQKMPDVLIGTLSALMENGAQFALVGEGDNVYEKAFLELAEKYRGCVAVVIGYQEKLAHRLLAGADMLLHPSRFEPCGLLPIYAMRYGTIPIVRNSGGMADSVTNATQQTIREGTATGFSFDTPSVSELVDCVHTALSLYRQPIAWQKMQASAMR